MRKPSLSESAIPVIALLVFLSSASLPTDAAAAVEFGAIEQQAMFAAAAYRPEGEVRDLVEAKNYDLSHFHTIADIQMSFFLATSESKKVQVVSVRGTSNVENAMVDIALKLLSDEKTGARLHQGFAYAAKRIYSELQPRLKPGYKVRTTGHSLGGAVALILAMYMDADGFDIDRVVTFGQPKVTNLPGAMSIQHLDVTRVVTPDDLVPLVPPFDPLDIKNIDIYWHAGKEILLLDGNQFAVLEAADSMLRATKFTQKPLTENNLKNHYMRLYLELVRARVKSSEQVPYRNTFNLFNLFGNDAGG
ncbi:MAG: lipase family protein [Gammaproteobacteria bacterium]|nr:lipase family protein [Gammaproteobacteria bacterium]